MGWLDVRSAIVCQLEAVKGIGVVHGVRRHTVFWDQFYKRHRRGGKAPQKIERVNNWEVTRVALNDDVTAVGGAVGNEPTFRLTHSVEVFGHMSLHEPEDDSDELHSEDVFQVLLEEIDERFRQHNLLDVGKGPVIELPRQAQFTDIGHGTFGGVLVHTATMTFEATERVGGC